MDVLHRGTVDTIEMGLDNHEDVPIRIERAGTGFNKVVQKKVSSPELSKQIAEDVAEATRCIKDREERR